MKMAWDRYYSFSYILLVFVWSIIIATAIVSVNKCGHLSVENPTILGRNVTFTFTPSVYDETATLLWQRTNKWNPWATLPQIYKFTQYEENGTFYLILTDTVSRNDESFYRMQYYNNILNCTMETPKLSFKDISRDHCGFVYRRTAKIELGKNVDIEYFPTKTDIDNPRTYIRKWVRSVDQKKVFLPSNLSGVYEDKAMSNNKYVFTIFSYNASMNGKYGVLCHSNAGNYYSNMVDVILQVAPSKLAFKDLKDIDSCTNCFVGEANDQFKVYCMINGGTKPMTVTMAIGNVTQKVTKDENGLYVAYFYLQNRHHMALMNCSVKNSALTFPLTVTAPVYVIESPTYQGVEMPRVLREGDSVNIRCKFAAGRPAPTLSLKYGNTNLSHVEQVNTFNATDQLYSSILLLTTFERVWNGKDISCCRSSNWYKEKSKCFIPKRVNYLFPPSDVKLQQIPKDNKPTEVYAVCTIYNSNPVCKANWQAPIGSIHSAENSRNISQPNGAWDSEYKVAINTSKRYNGENILCASDCSNFNISMNKSVPLPYAPVVEFNISDSFLDIPRGSQAQIKCTARSSPHSTISWMERTPDGEGLRKLKQCDLDTDCEVTIRGDNITKRSLFCNAENVLGFDSKELAVNIIEMNADATTDKENTIIYWVILGSVVGVVAIIGTVGLIVRKIVKDKRAKEAANQTSNTAGEVAERRGYNDEHGEVVQGLIDDAGQAISQSETMYCELDKTTHSENTTYSQLQTSLQQKNHTGNGQSAFDLTSTATQRKDSFYEYVNMDTAKKTELQKGENDQYETESTYTNL